MAYVGNQPVPQATQTRDRIVATSGQTSFATSGYTPQFVDVYLDGVKLDSSEYTASNGSDIVLNSGATTGQVLEVIAFSSFDVADIRNMTQPLGLKNYTTTERNALTNIGAGDTIFNSTTGSIEFYDGTNWIATNLIPSITSVSGNIYSGASSTLTLSVVNATDSIDVKYFEGGTLLATDSDVTATSGSATSTVPSAVYTQAAGDTISIQIFNQDGTPSSNSITKTVQATPTGGTITSADGYRIHTFTSSSSFVVPSGLSLSDVEYLVIGGGGAGGDHHGGGGGAGGYRCSVPGEYSGRTSTIESRLSLSAGSYTVTVGAGGSGSTGGNHSTKAASGGNSVFGSITSLGGGGGGRCCTDPGAYAGASGGAGGGAWTWGSAASGGSGTAGQGWDGYGNNGTDDNGGGGGGSSQSGAANGNGGNGLSSNITGSLTTRAGGGGAGWYMPGNGNKPGGAGGGGAGGNATGSHDSGNDGVAGAPNTGSGGGGTGSLNSYGGSGGSGIVIVRYQL
jgi:hypothetical protein